MSGKTAKKARKEEEAKLADYMARKDAFVKDVKALSEKYKIDLVGMLDYKDTALLATIAFVDVKDRYEQITEEAKRKLEAEANHTVKLEV